MIDLVLPLLAVIISFVIGFLVLSKNPKNKANQYFFILIFFLVIWILSNYLENVPDSLNYRSFFLKVDFASAILLSVFFYLFCLNFPKPKITNLWAKLLIHFPSIILAILSFIGLIIKNIRIESGTIQADKGVLFPLYFLFIFLYIGDGLRNLILKYKKSVGIERMQILYILLGLFISAIMALLMNLILPQLIFIRLDIARIGIYGILIFCVFTAYAISKYHLFNIKIIATELLTFTIWIFLLTRTLLAETLRDQMIDGTLLILVVLFGILLIKSVIREVEQREKLEVLNKKLEELNRLKSEFLSFASHQVKAPMAIVKGFAQLIYDGTLGLVPDKVKESAKKIVNSANKMIALVENLLDMRKIDEGKMEYNFTEVEINKLVNGVVEELRPMAQDKKLDLTFTGLANEIKIKADSQKLSQVFQNFVDNAIKYTPSASSGQAPQWVKVRIEAKENSVLITVSDSGRGLSQKLQPHLFEQFSRDSETAKEIQGTGLGLYIAKQIVEAHHGKIWAKSEGDNKGSTFFVEIPIK